MDLAFLPRSRRVQSVGRKRLRLTSRHTNADHFAARGILPGVDVNLGPDDVRGTSGNHFPCRYVNCFSFW